MLSDKPQPGDYQVEYSKSNRSKCKLTGNTIPKDALRIGKIVQSQSFDGTYPVWYNFDDWKEDKKLVKEFQTKCKKVWGLNKLRMEDQERVQKLMNVNGGSSGGNIVSPEDLAASSSPEQVQKRKEFEEENKKIWQIKDELKRLKLSSLREMLSENGQSEKGGEDLLIERCALGMMFGCLPECPNEKCQDGYMTFSGGKFKCHGKLEWTKCDYSLTVDEAFEKATDWIIPESLEDIDYFANFKFVKHKKCDYVLENVMTNTTATTTTTEGSSSSSSQTDNDDEIDPEKEKLPLGNYKIALSGKLSMKQNEIQDIIEENGGIFKNDVVPGCTHLVCTSKEYEKDTTKVKKAKKLNILIMDEDFIHMSAEKEKKLDESEYKDYILYNPADKKRKANSNGGDEDENEQELPKKKKLTIKGRAAVDEDCDDSEHLHVYENGNDVYSVHLNLTDLQTGINSYYIIQLLEHDHSKQYYCFRKWGRLNSSIGSHKLSEHGTSFYNALNEFTNTYYDKTGNHWEERHCFEKKPGRFFPIDVDYGDDDSQTDLDALEKKMDQEYHGSLHPEVASLVKLIFDVKTMKQTLKEMEIDTDKMPLGRLKKSHISKGYQVLNEIQNLLKQVREKEGVEKGGGGGGVNMDMTSGDGAAAASSSMDAMDTTTSGGTSGAGGDTTIPKNSIHHQCVDQLKQQFLTLSNKFYTIIPTSNPEIIDDENLLKEKIKMIEALQEMEIATSLLKSDSNDPNTIDPLDGYYKKLATHLTPLKKDSDLFAMVNEYLQNTHASTHREYSLELIDAFEVERIGESERFKAFENLHNRQLLWHGSRVSNFGGILSQGLRIAPPEAPATGYMFGKGIYFADMSSKSANYCRTSPDANVGILLLCDVALGEMYERLQADYIEKLPKGYHSCFGHGKTEPNDSMAKYICDGKVKVPLGTPTASKVPRHAALLYNEYIVYDIAQVNIKYLLKVKFNYKRGY
ncbi:hypothetical protein FDP41_010359 [Naegleria fowleri]|uniref:Poly [ADP-ribose] polymerase n=1 Tax=Naegleria fowleri TaxID=5763 RepID=A0A6A5C9T4_NAEFO|nr:uncharacterized protein FDP41_010359 [Naegleria fowleri]KAF0983294.1 hypothetical protein FDP41_010359 [Naegleria fowleri]